jgi:hypothetical protein
MSTKRPRSKKYFTVAEANAALPLLRAILRDVTELAKDLFERQERLSRVQKTSSRVDQPHQEEVQRMMEELEADQERMREYLQELKNLNVELKDYFTGLIDFPCRREGRDVYLCWRLGEPDVAHWHEIDAGFAGRQPLVGNAATAQ